LRANNLASYATDSLPVTQNWALVSHFPNASDVAPSLANAPVDSPRPQQTACDAMWWLIQSLIIVAAASHQEKKERKDRH
jgi:hypothetical protein